MNINLFSVRTVFMLCAVLSLLFSQQASAEKIIIEKEYSYITFGIDYLDPCRTIAFEESKRDLLKVLETRLESEVEIGNLELTGDQVATYAAGIVIPEVVFESFKDGECALKVKIEVDSEEVIRAFVSMYMDMRNIRTLEYTRREASELLDEAKGLTPELSSRGSMLDIQKQERFIKTIKRLMAIQWFERGFTLEHANNHKDAITAYDRAIELSPSFEAAFYNRGVAYQSLGKYDLAIKDYNRSIYLHPEYAEAYNRRGGVYGDLGNYQLAVRDYDKFIELKPMDAGAYYSRGVVHYDRYMRNAEGNNLEKAIADLIISSKMGYVKAQHLLGSLSVDWQDL